MSQQDYKAGQGVTVDTRPIPLVILTKSYRSITLIGAVLIFLLIINLPTPEGLTYVGQKALAAFALCLVLWITRALPLAVTSLLALVLIPMLGILESTEAFSLFGNQAVFFILGAFILAAAMMKSGLSSHMALIFLRRFGGSPGRLLAGVLLVPAFLSFLMPEHAVAAMMFPIVLEVAHGLDLNPQKTIYGQAIFHALAWGAAIGGVATYLGGARNALAVGILKQSTGQFIGFFEWMIAVLPTVLVMLGVAYLVLRRFFPSEINSVDKAVKLIEEKNKSLGKMNTEQRLIGIIMIFTIIAWVTLGSRFELASIAIIAVVALFVFQLIKWKDLEEYVNWGIILMYGGAIALGFALEKSGASSWLAKVTVTKWTDSPFMLIALIALVSLLLTEGMSNAAVVAMLMPVGLGIAKEYGIDYKIMVFAISVPAGLGFAFPIASPPNAIAYSSGFIKPRKMFTIGIMMDFIAIGVFLLMTQLYWPLINLDL